MCFIYIYYSSRNEELQEFCVYSCVKKMTNHSKINSSGKQFHHAKCIMQMDKKKLE